MSTTDLAVVQQYLPYVVGVSVVALGALYLMNRSVREVKPAAANTYSTEVGNATDGIAPRRGKGYEELQASPNPSIKTVFDVLEYAAKKFADKPALGTRKFIKMFEEKKVVDGVERSFTFPQLGGYEWINYKEFHKRVIDFGAGLRGIGMNPGDFLAIFEDTRAEWSIAARGAYSQSLVVFTVYANLGDEALVYALNQGEIKYMVANVASLKLLLKISDKVPTLKHIITTDGFGNVVNEVDVASLKKKSINVTPFGEVLSNGAKEPVAPVPPSPKDLACIMYTSGSTGVPKGVMISHANVVAAAGGVAITGIKITSDDRLVHYLPLAHSFAFMLESTMVFNGCALGYGTPRTLSNAGVRNCEGDIKECRPTLLVGVPAVFEKIKHGITNRINSSGAVTKTLFGMAFQAKLNAIRSGGDTPIWNKIVFRKFSENVGGCLRVMFSGSAPLNPDVQDFLRVCFGVPVLQGWGLTETTGIGSAQRYDDLCSLRIGAPVPSNEMKLVDVPDMGYTAQTKPCPMGEIMLRGHNVTMGYYKDKVKTDEVFLPGGWFATGDIGRLNPDGSFSIVDRKKHLIKPPHGEYIALEKLESVYRNCNLIESLCVYVDSMHYHCVCIAVPVRDVFLEWCKSHNFNVSSYEAACEDPAICSAILLELQAVGRKFGLKSIETIRAIRLLPETWTPQNKYLTAAMKLNRPYVTDVCKDYIKKMYDELAAQEDK